MPKKLPLRICFFVDGFTLKKVNEFYRFHHPYHSRIDFRSLKNWARCEALRVFAPGTHFALMEGHYYHPYKNPRIHGYNTEGMTAFERELRFVGFDIHYAQTVGEDGGEPNLTMIEDALMFASFKRMDVAVLLSTQGQYKPLPDRLASMGVPTLLLGWNFSYPKQDRWVHWKTDGGLRENCAYYVAMNSVADKHPPEDKSLACLFQPKRRTAVRAPRPWMGYDAGLLRVG
ncbi:MAG: NYN domain-containing protein [Fibrobacter sp.]|uniref:NYN domain-containing protein n=1 Tax=Fibrobacter sp. TaxID=35828 RepID=UPI00388F647D|nr:NYN domain-containing protein [Fibrobacter sp.]